MGKAVKKTVGWIQNFEIIILVGMVLLCLGGMPFGIKTYGVLTGSMEPAIHTGSLAYVQTGIECSEIVEGDVIAFDIDAEKVVTHRVVENDIVNRLIVTKGDANDAADAAPVSYGNVLGKTVYSIPNLGFVLMAFNENKVAWLGGLIVFNVLLCIIVRSVSRGNISTERKKNGKGKDPYVESH